MPEAIWPSTEAPTFVCISEKQLLAPSHWSRFLGPLPTSNGCRYILLIGDYFTKYYEAIPLPDQTAAITSDSLLER